MTSARIPQLGRRIGYALMAAALLIAVAARRGLLAGWSETAVTAAALVVGAVGAMLVFTELMVRGLYAQVDAAQARETADDGPAPQN